MSYLQRLFRRASASAPADWPGLSCTCDTWLGASRPPVETVNVKGVDDDAISRVSTKTPTPTDGDGSPRISTKVNVKGGDDDDAVSTPTTFTGGDGSPRISTKATLSPLVTSAASGWSDEVEGKDGSPTSSCSPTSPGWPTRRGSRNGTAGGASSMSTNEAASPKRRASRKGTTDMVLKTQSINTDMSMEHARSLPVDWVLSEFSHSSSGEDEDSPVPVGSKGWKLEDFDLVKTIGSGFIGSVRMVKLAKLDDATPFALKIMKKRKVIKKAQVQHVMQEKTLLSSIEHPFIVKLRTTFQDDAHLFMVMEFVNGGELLALRNRYHGAFPSSFVKFYACEIALALGHLHGKNIAYRDLKLENVLLDSQGHVKLVDFGFAKVVETQTFTVCGTPEYLAPEIIQQKGHNHSADWWAFGVLVYEMLAGWTPFWSDAVHHIYYNIKNNEPQYPSSRFSSQAKDVLCKLLTKDPAGRLGAGPDGAADVMGHDWFFSVDWDAVLRKRCRPPFRPPVEGDCDTCMFDNYPEESVNPDAASGIKVADQELFQGF